MESFNEHIENKKELDLIPIMEQIMNEEISPEDEILINEAVQAFEDEEMTLGELENIIMNEGIFGSIFGGLTGFALGKSVGKMIAKALGISSGVFYDLLTSRLVGAALGSAMGKKI